MSTPIARSVFLTGTAAMFAAAALPLAAQTTPVVRVIGPAGDGFTAAFVGVKLGAFKKYGLDVQASIVSNGAAAAAALSGGAADVSYTNTISVIQAHARNIPLQFIAPGGLTTSQAGLVHAYVLKDSPLVKASDFNGKTLATPALRDFSSAVIMAWMDKNGGDSKSLRELELPASSGLAFLQSKRADVVVLSEPAASEALASGLVREVGDAFSALGGPIDAAGYVLLAPAVNANRDVYVRFAQAMHEAEMYTNAHQAETADVLASFSGQTKGQIRKSRRNMYSEYLEPKIFQPLVDISARYGLIDKGFPASELISPAAVKPPR